MVTSAKPVTVRGLAALAKIQARRAVARLQEAGLPVKHPSDRIAPNLLRQAREVLGLRGRVPQLPATRPLSEQTLIVRCLRPLREKGKIGRQHTTDITNVYGHGVPDHEKDAARVLVERLLATGALEEKMSVGRRHVWITPYGLTLLRASEYARESA